VPAAPAATPAAPPATTSTLGAYLSGAKRALARSLLGFALVVPDKERRRAALSAPSGGPHHLDEASQIFGDNFGSGDGEAGGEDEDEDEDGEDGEFSGSSDDDGGGEGGEQQAGAAAAAAGDKEAAPRPRSLQPLKRFGTLKRVENDEEFAHVIGGCWCFLVAVQRYGRRLTAVRGTCVLQPLGLHFAVCCFNMLYTPTRSPPLSRRTNLYRGQLWGRRTDSKRAST